MKTLTHTLLSSGIILTSLSATSQAATIEWGGAMFTQNYSSDGTSLAVGATAMSPTGSVMFELGIFKSGFVPQTSNALLWSDNWVPFDTAAGGQSAYNSPVNGVATATNENFFGGSIQLGSDSGEIPTYWAAGDPDIPAGATNVITDADTQIQIGAQVYIWGFDSKDTSGIATGTTPEWVLFGGTDAAGTGNTSWQVPDSEATSNGSFTSVWDVHTATTAVVGQIAEEPPGGGTMEDPLNPEDLISPFQKDNLQFAAVPEPSSVILFLVSSTLVLRRRRKPLQ